MDGLIGLLVVIGIGLLSSSGKKKKAQQKAAQKARAFRNAAEMMEGEKKAKKTFDGGDWKQILAQAEEQAARPAEKSAAPAKPAAKAAPIQARPLLHLENDEPEGSISTQGESAAEHAKHRQKVLAEEESLRLEHEALQDVRNMNLQKLRTAVVMSEVLGKPVSLRRRSN